MKKKKEINTDGMRIVDTIHNKVKYWLVFDGNNEVIGKFEKLKYAKEYCDELWYKETGEI